MKNLTSKKIVLDVVMAIIMISLLNLNFTGIKLHEILGLLIFFLFLFHNVFNFKWIKAITTKLINKNIMLKTKIMYVVDVILLVLVVLNVYTGILISKYTLTTITANNIPLTSDLHHIFAYLLISMLIVHVGLHWKQIRNMVNHNKSLCEKIALFLIAMVIVFTVATSNTIRKLFITPKETNSHYRNKDEDNQTVQYEISEEIDKPTLEEFLSKLICTACERHCLLTNPECGRGARELQQEIQNYNYTYNANESYDVGFGDSSANREKHYRERNYNESYEGMRIED